MFTVVVGMQSLINIQLMLLRKIVFYHVIKINVIYCLSPSSYIAVFVTRENTFLSDGIFTISKQNLTTMVRKA